MENILIVEDDQMIGEIYERKFRGEGFGVFRATDGEMALEMLRKEKIDFILLDLILPKIDGFTVIERIREIPDYDRIKIIVLSNLSALEDRDRAIKAGANGFVTKSDWAPSALVKEIERILASYEDSERIGKAEQAQADASEKINEQKKILIIEDEDVFAEVFGTKLYNLGYYVTIAKNGAEGLSLAQSGEFDLFIIDEIVPVITGSEIVAQIKLDPKTKNIPVIILSSGDPEEQKKATFLGVDAFFVKSQVIPNELSEKVEELIGKNNFN